MYTFESAINNQPIISLQTGQQVGRIGSSIIDLSSLEMLAFTCIETKLKGRPIVLIDDVRQFTSDCVIVDSEDELTDFRDVIRLNKIEPDKSTPIEKPVYTDTTGQKLGNVEDMKLNLDTNRVQQLHVQKRVLFILPGPRLVIDRTQVVDITSQRIIVRDSTEVENLLAREPLPEANH